MCLPGPIHRPTGVVGSTAILPGWVGVAAADEMRRRLDLPILVDNDANLAALAEAAFGAGRDAKDLVYLMISSDLGAQRVIADAGRAIGRAAATLVNVLNPELLIVGGDLADAGDLLLDGVRESLGRAALPSAAEAATVVAGSLGDRAEVLGAIALVLSEAERDHPLRPIAPAVTQ